MTRFIKLDPSLEGSVNYDKLYSVYLMCQYCNSSELTKQPANEHLRLLALLQLS